MRFLLSRSALIRGISAVLLVGGLTACRNSAPPMADTGSPPPPQAPAAEVTDGAAPPPEKTPGMAALPERKPAQEMAAGTQFTAARRMPLYNNPVREVTERYGEPNAIRQPGAFLMPTYKQDLPDADQQYVYYVPGDSKRMLIYVKAGRVVLGIEEWRDL